MFRYSNIIIKREYHSVTPEYIPRIYLLLHIVQAAVISVGYDAVAHGLELFKIIYYLASEECHPILKGGLIDDYRSALGLDALHDSLNRALSEIIGVALHG